MREPRPPFAPIHAELLESLVEVARERCRAASVVLQREHADAPCLAVVERCELDRARFGSRVPHRFDDRIELAGLPLPEERERDVQVLARHDPDGRQLVALPILDLVESPIGEAQGEKEANPSIAAHASPPRHASSSRLPSKSARRRWSAVTAARTRTCSRSPGRSSIRASEPSEPAACT